MRRLFSVTASNSSFEREIHQVLSFFRFAGFAIAATVLFSTQRGHLTNPQVAIIISSVGVYSIIKIIFHFRFWQRDIATHMILLGDLAICIGLILLTGGINSPFLFYSLLPTATAALFFEIKISLIIATTSTASLVLAHTVLARITPSFTPIAEGNSLSIVLAYGLFCFLIATITYSSNLNVYRRIESKAITDERTRLRQEIHDGTAQVLGYLRTKIELLKKNLPSSTETLLHELEEICQLVSTSSEDIREAIDSLAVEVKPVSLVSSLSSYTKQVSQKTGSRVEFDAPNKLLSLHPTAQLQLLRIAQEALTNIRKHAKATQIWVKLENSPQGVELVVRDNGQGFSPSVLKGSGLKIMEERANSINGILSVTSTPGEGTIVTAKIPGG